MASSLHLHPDRRQILALGGHEFRRRPEHEAIVEAILALAPSACRICLLPTASGDAAEQIAAFRALLGGRVGVLSHVSLFRREHESLDLRSHLLAQDVIYVGGGSMVNLLAVWEAHGVGAILLEAWRRGIFLCGQSAGAMCWFEHGISRSAGTAEAVAGLGAIAGTMSAHYHRDADRRDALLQRVRAGGGIGYGINDGAGILIRGTTIEGMVGGVSGTGAWQVKRAADGRVSETALPLLRLDPRPSLDEAIDAVDELRLLRSLTPGRGPQSAASRRSAG